MSNYPTRKRNSFILKYSTGYLPSFSIQIMRNYRTFFIHFGLFLLTFFTTTMVGAENVTGKIWLGFGLVPENMLLHAADFTKGLIYSVSFLSFLTLHEFGHYFTAMYHQVKASLPYYIPVWLPIPGAMNIGSFGAIIRMEEIPRTTKQFFDIGIAGPLAGFVVSVTLIIIGLQTLPEKEYVLGVHPEYAQQFGGVPNEAEQVAFIVKNNIEHPEKPMQTYRLGKNLLFTLIQKIVPHNGSRFPTSFEIFHYPLLFVGFLTLFFTALNLLPIGQLDGGHVIYGMFGRKTAGIISRICVLALMFVGGTGLLDFAHLSENYLSMGLYFFFSVYIFNHIFNQPKALYLLGILLLFWLIQTGIKFYFPNLEANEVWLLYSFMAVRFIKLDHPAALIEHKVGLSRQILGWLAIIIFILCFTPNPVQIFGV